MQIRLNIWKCIYCTRFKSASPYTLHTKATERAASSVAKAATAVVATAVVAATAAATALEAAPC